jgi:hypothetical protein
LTERRISLSKILVHVPGDEEPLQDAVVGVIVLVPSGDRRYLLDPCGESTA